MIRMPFEHRVRVRFYQADPAQVLYFGRIFELVGDAYEELMRAAGFDVEALLRLEKYATPIVHCEADYRRPMRVGEPLVVRVLVEQVGASSVTMGYAIVGEDGETRATAQVVHVWVDGATFRKAELPIEARRIFDALRDAAGGEGEPAGAAD
jgi:YbgC/YbaW family acyl-CoA thioester hydrolase